MRAEILTIGDELCRGEIVDTNSATLAARLWDLDITPRWLTSCCDDAEDIVAAIRLAVGRSDLVICSGGLGPTEDDLTVDVVAGLAGVPPVIDGPARARMEAWFASLVPARRGPPKRGDLGEIQLRQVRIPRGARVHPNHAGLAPGFEIAIAGVPVLCMPGFPREVASILDGGMLARIAELREQAGVVERIARRIYRVFGRGESQISVACRGIVDEVPGATIHYQVKFPETLVKIVVRDRDADLAGQHLATIDAALHQRLAGPLYAVGEESMVERCVRRLVASKRTVATAESCTGGMIGELITRVAGSSAIFPGGAITYSNEEKVRQLGVPVETLAAHGAVSEETVRAMALGARARFGTDFAIAVSGVAGPAGGSPEKPVGTVWLALAKRTPTGGEILATRKLGFPSTRDQIRILTAWWALAMVDAAVSLDGALPGDAFDHHARWRLGNASNVSDGGAA
ncbi:MAG: nicotinamide-nucleotide amidohydrolase family protein [Proteobacteria bacterium]|nr:nicotinamide-nucleotide amidohydrolase family protein [Pseudomonadota bacterium]